MRIYVQLRLDLYVYLSINTRIIVCVFCDMLERIIKFFVIDQCSKITRIHIRIKL